MIREILIMLGLRLRFGIFIMKEEFFDKRIKNPTSKWREVSSNVRIHSNDIIVDVLKEVAEAHYSFYN
jgi:hypothetical protein